MKKPGIRRIVLGFAVTLIVLVVVMALAVVWLVTTPAGLRTVVDAVEGYIPSELSFQHVEGRLIGPVTVREVTYASEGVTVSFEQGLVDWRVWALLDGELLVEKLEVSNLVIELKPTDDGNKPAPQLPTVRAPIPMQIENFRITSIVLASGEQEMEVQALTGQLGWRDERVDVVRLEMQSEFGDAQASGHISLRDAYPMRLQLRHTLTINGYAEVAGAVGVDGDVTQLNVDGSWDAPYDLALQATAADLLDSPKVSFDAVGQPALLNQLNEAWPPVQIRFAVNGDGPVGATSLRGSMAMLYESIDLNADYQLQLGGKGVIIEGLSLSGPALSSPVVVTGDVDWSPELVGDVTVRWGAFEVPGVDNAQTSGVAMLRGGLDGFVASAQGSLRIGQERLPLDIDADIGLTREAVRVKSLRAVVGANRLTANGSVTMAATNAALQWQMDAPDLALIERAFGLPLAGSLNGSGRVSGSMEQPHFTAKFHAEHLRYEQFSIEGATFTADFATHKTDSLVEVHATNLALAPDTLVPQVDVVVTGERSGHQIDVNAHAFELQVELALQGALDDEMNWRYALQNLQLARESDDRFPSYLWELSADTTGVVAAEGVHINELCLEQQRPRLDDRPIVCAQADYVAGAITGASSISNLNLAMFAPLLPEDLKLEGRLNGTALWAEDVRRSQMEFSIEPIDLAVRLDKRWQPVLQTKAGRVSLVPKADELELTVELPVEDGSVAGKIAFDSRMPELASWPMHGHLTVELAQIGWIAGLVSEFEKLDAGVSASLDLAGTVGEPEVVGSVSLEAREAVLMTPQLTLTDTQLQIMATSSEALFTGRLNSGGGTLELVGAAYEAGGWEPSLNINGERFLVSDTHEARVFVSPDVAMKFDFETLRLRGRVAIPAADLRLAKVPESAVVISEDQVIVSDDPVDEPSFVTDAALTVTLGQEVFFSGLGLTAQLAGDLEITDKAGEPTTAVGNVSIIEGQYDAYGQSLEIKQGEVIFAGGPIDAPGISLRAERQATLDVVVGVDIRGPLRTPRLSLFSTPSMSETDQLAYLVLGRPMELASTGESSALQQAAMALSVQGGSLLTSRLKEGLGVDQLGIETEPGGSSEDAAVVIGKYLSPKLYMSYGYGLFKPLSTLRLEYTLSRLWQITTESSNEGTGGDIRWVLER